MNPSQNPESPSQTLARSAFGFAFLALIPAIITWFGFLLAEPSPFPIFRTIRLVLLIGFGLFLLFLIGLCRYFYRSPKEKIIPSSEKITAAISNKWAAIGLIFLLLEVNLLAFLLLWNIAPSITNPGKFLLVCWSLLLLGIIYTVNRHAFEQWLEKTRAIWLGIGFLVIAVLLLGSLLILNNWLLTISGANDLLRGGLDYRELHFYDDGLPTPTPPEFWAEQAQTRVRWSPYTYWLMAEFHGQFINVGADGIRATAAYGDESDAKIYFFGGSTMWGEGARDNYTIPSHVARLFNEAGIPQNIVNYGESGFVSSQDLIWFQLQLLRGNVPDVAIFYQGFNDVLSAWGGDVVGVTLQEEMRLNDSEAGRILRSNQPVLRLPTMSLDTLDMTQAGFIDATPETIAERYLANRAMIEALVESYGVKVLFVWQPAIMFKDMLSESEQAIYQRTEKERPNLFALYTEVDTIVRQRLAATENTLILSELFANETDTIFHDLVHITEIGNAHVAEALLPNILALIEN
jgi:lysophospholipase L1-like esterase